MNSTKNELVCEHCNKPLSGKIHAEPDFFKGDTFYHLDCFAIVYAKREAATARIDRLERGE